jgi:hypothetical protein
MVAWHGRGGMGRARDLIVLNGCHFKDFTLEGEKFEAKEFRKMFYYFNIRNCIPLKFEIILTLI